MRNLSQIKVDLPKIQNKETKLLNRKLKFIGGSMAMKNSSKQFDEGKILLQRYKT